MYVCIKRLVFFLLFRCCVHLKDIFGIFTQSSYFKCTHFVRISLFLLLFAQFTYFFCCFLFLSSFHRLCWMKKRDLCSTMCHFTIKLSLAVGIFYTFFFKKFFKLTRSSLHCLCSIVSFFHFRRISLISTE